MSVKMREGYEKIVTSKRLQLLTTILLLILIALIGTYSTSSYLDSDMLWHYIVGRDTVKGGIFADTYYTWQTNAGIWNQHEWLFDVFLYFVCNLFGATGQMILYGVAASGLVLLGIVLSKPKNPAIYALFALIVHLSFAFIRCNRPITYSLYILMVILWIYKRDGSKLINCILIGLLTILLANLHGGMLITEIAMLGLLSVLNIVADILNRQKLSWKRLGTWLFDFKYMCIAIVCSGACPGSFPMLLHAFQLSNIDSTQYIQEWQPFYIHLFSGVVLGVIFLSFGYALKSTRNLSYFSKSTVQNVGLCSALFILALSSQKAFSVAYIAFLLLGYQYVENLLYDITSDKVKNIAAKCYDVHVVCLILILFITGSVLYPNITKFKDLDSWAMQKTSTKIIQKLKDIQMESEDVLRIGHGYSYGNYLIWNDIKCFVDTRQFMYDKDLTDGVNQSVNDVFLVSTTKDKETVAKFLDTYDFDYIVTDEDFDLNWYLSENDQYELILSDELTYKEENTTVCLWKCN